MQETTPLNIAALLYRLTDGLTFTTFQIKNMNYTSLEALHMILVSKYCPALIKIELHKLLCSSTYGSITTS